MNKNNYIVCMKFDNIEAVHSVYMNTPIGITFSYQINLHFICLETNLSEVYLFKTNNQLWNHT